MIINSMMDLGPDLGAFTEGAKFIVNILIAKNQKKIKKSTQVRLSYSMAQRQNQLYIYNFWHVIFFNAVKIAVSS